MGPALLGALFTAGKAGWDYFSGKRREKQARSAAMNDPRRLIRNALLEKLWREGNLAERFKGAFPAAPPGMMGKSPENILRWAQESGMPETRTPGLGTNLAQGLLSSAMMYATRPKGADDDDYEMLPFDGNERDEAYSPGAYRPRNS